MASEKCITIIGGGFSGTLTAVQLLRQSPFPVCVKLINAGYPLSKGVAYSAESNLHLLNVRSGRMSAFPHIPRHFVNWLETQPDVEQFCQPGETLADAFMPRRVYGQYVANILKMALEKLPAGSKLEIIEDEAISIAELSEKHFLVELKNGPSFQTEKIVLALGNFAPEPLRLPEEILTGENYFGNPWKPEILEDLRPEEPVLLVGSGLTMVDVVLSLLEQKFTGKIIAISPKGYLPMVHRHTAPYPDFRKELQGPFSLNTIYAALKQHIRKAVAQGSSCEALIDSMRPQTQQIWQGLSKEDKQKFLRHLSSLWGIFRHRISPQVADRIQAARDSGQLEVKPARLQNATETDGKLRAMLKLRGQKDPETIPVQRIINCTGPQANYARLTMPLVQNLLVQKLITADELQLGLKAMPDGRLIQENGKPSCKFFTIGPTMRGALWESTAVPEISEQAAHLAQTILHAFLPEAETKAENTSAQTKR
ncbi:FAD/NAD(P)-binding protein [Adhaeribacter sp. BT258]|uniref:FAD/NAD(P)-binding protein n=1 Tax=Adhaeribacter terrigena TaxID=2793070 RepID=A0ABS1BWQ1_9BACT|nr:FAD/NAD(P)-binding protein [Adhaeribacter terrigena]MBK0401484.1 FAD/NAD(P)-binding protein [Adhaeribacter terrigena]